MAERVVRIASAHGLHARPAKLFAEAAAASGSAVTLTKPGGKPVNGASILGLITLALGHDDEVTLGVTGGDEETVLEALAAQLLTDQDAS